MKALSSSEVQACRKQLGHCTVVFLVRYGITWAVSKYIGRVMSFNVRVTLRVLSRVPDGCRIMLRVVK